MDIGYEGAAMNVGRYNPGIDNGRRRLDGYMSEDEDIYDSEDINSDEHSTDEHSADERAAEVVREVRNVRIQNGEEANHATEEVAKDRNFEIENGDGLSSTGEECNRNGYECGNEAGIEGGHEGCEHYHFSEEIVRAGPQKVVEELNDEVGKNGGSKRKYKDPKVASSRGRPKGNKRMKSKSEEVACQRAKRCKGKKITEEDNRRQREDDISLGIGTLEENGSSNIALEKVQCSQERHSNLKGFNNAVDMMAYMNGFFQAMQLGGVVGQHVVPNFSSIPLNEASSCIPALPRCTSIGGTPIPVQISQRNAWMSALAPPMPQYLQSPFPTCTSLLQAMGNNQFQSTLE